MDKRSLEQPIRTTLGSAADVGPHASIDAVKALSEDILRFRTDSKVPERLSRYVRAPKETQVIWYKKLLEAWTQSKSLPETSEEATMLVCDTLQSLHPDAVNLEGFLYCYGLSHYCSLPKLMHGKASLVEDDAMKFSLNTPDFTALGEALTVGEDALGFLVLNTLPVKKSRVTDGLCLGVSVEIKKFYLLPSDILSLISKRRRALAKGDTKRACTLLEEINGQEDYEVVEINSQEVLAKKYSIKIRGLEESMLNGAEARDKLVKMVDNKRLRIKVAYIDDGKHFVGDVFCGDINLQDALKGESATC